MGLFGRRTRSNPAAEAAQWQPEEWIGTSLRYLNAALPGASVDITAEPVNYEGPWRVEIRAVWTAPGWQHEQGELLALVYDTDEDAEADAATIMKWLGEGCAPAELLPDLHNDQMLALICGWDGQPFSVAEAGMI
jgi:hypothetical protein